MTRKRITVVALAYNQVEGIAHFVESLLAVLDTLPYDSAILLVDDGSTAGTRERLDAVQAGRRSRIGVLHLPRNFGYQAAITGMDYAEGEAAITMDADIQHPPSLLQETVRPWEEGFDVVQTIRRRTERAGGFKSLASRAFYQVINKFSSTPIEPNASDSFSASKILWPVLFDAAILSRGIPPRKASCNGCPG